MTTVPNPTPVPLPRLELFHVIARLLFMGAPAPLVVECIEWLPGWQLSLTLPDNDRAGVEAYADAFQLPRPWFSDYTVRGGTARLYQSRHRASGSAVTAGSYGGWFVSVECIVPIGDVPDASPECAPAASEIEDPAGLGTSAAHEGAVASPRVTGVVS